jgi:hypothetical protein
MMNIEILNYTCHYEDRALARLSNDVNVKISTSVSLPSDTLKYAIHESSDELWKWKRHSAMGERNEVW